MNAARRWIAKPPCHKEINMKTVTSRIENLQEEQGGWQRWRKMQLGSGRLGQVGRICFAHLGTTHHDRRIQHVMRFHAPAGARTGGAVPRGDQGTGEVHQRARGKGRRQAVHCSAGERAAHVPQHTGGHPERLIYHVRNAPAFELEDIEILVMDKADRLLEKASSSRSLCGTSRRGGRYNCSRSPSIAE